MNEFIKSSLNKVGSTAGKAGRALADGFLEEMGSTARKLSKDKRVTEENREKYSQTADTISLLREHLHQDSEVKLSKRKLPKNEQQTANINSSEIQSTLTNQTILYFNEAKETIQLNNSTSDNDIGELTLDEWDKNGYRVGNWQMQELTNLPQQDSFVWKLMIKQYSLFVRLI